ncbi:MAG TPA: hypothetical protein GXX70_04865 [Tepidimicrobium sp.]|nr:hypothetical protein [Tepidimicrobium sp.]
MNIFDGLGLLFGVGGAIVLSILKDQRRDGETNIISQLLSLITGILLTVFGLIYLERFSIL